jgi:hypothetical protein
MPPPPKAIKLKSHKSKPKLEPLPFQTPASTSTAPVQEESSFEEELYWCINKLEQSLESGKLNPKQGKFEINLWENILSNINLYFIVEDTRKSIKILKSPNQPIIKKRQLMRNTFGDYRKKKNEEKLKELDTSKFKIKTTNPSKQSYFVKKTAIVNGEKNFKFNFDINQLEGLNLTNEAVNTTDDMNVKAAENIITLAPSDNGFRFNFEIEQ